MCAEPRRSIARLVGLAVTAAALSAILGAADAALPADGVQIEAPDGPLAAGETLALKLKAGRPDLRRVDWAVLAGPGFVLPNGEYHAPYTVGATDTLVTVGAFALTDSGRVRAEVTLRLTPGEIAGAADCRGPGQARLPEYDDLRAPDELPALVTRADAVVPRPKRGPAARDTIPIHALLCRDGRVIDAYVPPAYFEVQGRPVAPDSARVRVALDAARRYVFRPGKVQGQPVATWMILFVPLTTR